MPGVERQFINNFRPASPDAAVLAQPSSQEAQSLVTQLHGFKLDVHERRTALAINALPLPPETQRALFAADLFLRGAFIRAPKLGFAYRELASGRDYVVVEEEGQTDWERVKSLRRNSDLLITANLKKYNFTHAQIATRMHVEKKHIDVVAGKLVDLGLGKKTAKTRVLENLCVKVAEADKQAGSSPLGTNVLAGELGVSKRQVDEARRRNRAQARPSTPGKDRVAEQVASVRDAIIAAPQKSDMQILAELQARGEGNLNRSKIQHARHGLIRERIINSKRPDLSYPSQVK